ncbi:DUF6630 family protein [Marinigracilibium pacificum]|uniref:DUF6630 domain-containing protein n=1 Tax=Marinigracilibium pacificum TaxID=2729599 RepID=A0A848ITM4_9BACT|nr:hypothetical protein [Marinigracilibium pacificum]NMM47697.1 hypothetical protein [Marinigracilibium pacificum]
MKSVVIFLIIILVIGEFTYAQKKSESTNNKYDLLEIGQLIYLDYKEEFRAYLIPFLDNKAEFIEENEDLIDEYGFEEINVLEAIYMFGDYRGLLGYIDWRGEENENEVEEYVEKQLGVENYNWINTQKLRQSVDYENLRDGEFIIELFKAIDKDLKAENKQLLFFNLDIDAYVFIATTNDNFNTICKIEPNSFYRSNKLN